MSTKTWEIIKIDYCNEYVCKLLVTNDVHIYSLQSEKAKYPIVGLKITKVRDPMYKKLIGVQICPNSDFIFKKEVLLRATHYDVVYNHNISSFGCPRSYQQQVAKKSSGPWWTKPLSHYTT